MKLFRWVCWMPAATWLYARAVVGRYEGWGAWAAAPILMVPVAVSALFLGAGLLLLSSAGATGRAAWDRTAIGVAALPLLWIALQLVTS